MILWWIGQHDFSRFHKGIVKKFPKFFSNYVPSGCTFSRLPWIDCAKPFFEIRPGTCFLADNDFRPHGTIYGQKSKFAQKVCSRSNFEKNFDAIDSGEPGEGASRGHIIRKKFRKLFGSLQNRASIAGFFRYKVGNWFLIIFFQWHVDVFIK